VSVGDVFERITFHDYDIGKFARFNAAGVEVQRFR
jgi:hypothetical protein